MVVQRWKDVVRLTALQNFYRDFQSCNRALLEFFHWIKKIPVMPTRVSLLQIQGFDVMHLWGFPSCKTYRDFPAKILTFFKTFTVWLASFLTVVSDLRRSNKQEARLEESWRPFVKMRVKILHAFPSIFGKIGCPLRLPTYVHTLFILDWCYDPNARKNEVEESQTSSLLMCTSLLMLCKVVIL